MDNLTFIIIATAILGFGLFSRKLQDLDISPAMTFVTFGIIIGPAALGITSVDLDATFIKFVAEVALIMILFTDAMHIDLEKFIQNKLPKRLLFVGLPLMIIIGVAVAAFIFKGTMNIWHAAVIAILLSPTDAALGKAIIDTKTIPIKIREALNAESGLNDGMVLPGLLVALAFATAAGGAGSPEYWIKFVVLQLTLGPLVGISIGYFGGYLVDKSAKARWMLPIYQKLAAIALALLAYSVAQVVGGNGFISAFCAGMAIGIRTKAVRKRVVEFGETEGQQLALITFLIFGAAMVPTFIKYANWQAVVYALLSLTVIRVGTVMLGMIGAKQKWQTVLILGWFGPRGVASILFAFILLTKHQPPGYQYILSVVTLTVLFSVFAHGLTAKPCAKWYSKQLKSKKA